MYNLMIVEAPPKAKKIESILKEAGLNYKVVATAGYIKDLPKNEYALNFNEKDLKEYLWKILSIMHQQKFILEKMRKKRLERF